MKRLFLLILSSALLFSTLIGCSTQSRGEKTVPPSLPPETSQPQEMTQGELYAAFQQAYDSCGGSLSQPSEQFSAELDALQGILSASTAIFPENYQMQYEEWRTEKLAALEEEAAQLKEAYAKVIASRPLYSYVTTGLCHADYIDFDNDGKQELLLLTLSAGMEEGISITIEVYGEAQGHAEKYGEESVYLESFQEISMALVKNGDCTYIRSYCLPDGMANGDQYSYFGIDNGTLTMIDTTSIYHDNPGTGYEVSYYSAETVITEDQYNAIHAKYTGETIILSFVGYGSQELTINRGILPELSSDIQYKDALLKALDEERDILYAKLIDMDQDGIEDLLTFRKKSEYGKSFRLYSWDGTGIQTLDLDQTTDEEINGYLQIGFHDFGIYRERSTGKLYVNYGGEIVGGWGGELFIRNASDFTFYGAPFFGSGEDIIEEEYLAQVQEYEDTLDNRFETVETFTMFYLDDPLSETIESVRQKLSA